MVGGFLGSGKTTLILSAAKRLSATGRRVAVIMNDQAGELVDTRLALAAGVPASEITGGCFCCRFSEFAAQASVMLADSPEVIFAEPVGSCTDLAATVLAPLRIRHGARFRLAPFTVVVDPERARRLLSPDADPDLAYLFRKQLDEADLVVQSKLDLHGGTPAAGGATVMPVSAVTGEGLDAWLDAVLNDDPFVPAIPLEIDYARYAAAEAALAWMNWRAALVCAKPLTPAAVVGPVLQSLQRELVACGAEIAHLKAFVQSRTGYVKASICAAGEKPAAEGTLDAPPVTRHEFVLNMRVKADPQQLEAALAAALVAFPGRAEVGHLECFRPSPPTPESRIASE